MCGPLAGCYSGFSLVVVLGLGYFLRELGAWQNHRVAFDLPSWVAELPVPLGFSLLSAQAICELITLWGNETVSLGSSHE